MEITGWTYDYIDQLSYAQQMEIFTIHEVLTDYRMEQRKKAARR